MARCLCRIGQGLDPYGEQQNGIVSAWPVAVAQLSSGVLACFGDAGPHRLTTRLDPVLAVVAHSGAHLIATERMQRRGGV